MVLSQQKIPQTVEMLGFVKDVVFLLVCASNLHMNILETVNEKMDPQN